MENTNKKNFLDFDNHSFLDVDISNMTSVELEQKITLDDSMLTFKENVTNSILSMMKEVEDEETQLTIIQTIGEATKGGEQFDDKTKIEISDTVTKVVLDIIAGEDVTQSVSKRRRRRETTQEDDSDENVGLSPETVIRIHLKLHRTSIVIVTR